jgi:hypothetical protein
MRITLCGVACTCLLFVSPSSFAAEPPSQTATPATSSEARPTAVQGRGYAVAGLAGVSGFFGSLGLVDVAGGGEVLVGGHAGAGGEFGVMANGSVLTLFSVNGVFHFSDARARGRLSPFVTSGYTKMSDFDESFDGWNVGGGVDVWGKKGVGFRFDVRDHVRPDPRGTVQYWMVRAGVVFR